ncbi:hypothetical protein GOODEAATRI_033626 [Goodea atripinnis]|uniref:Peptidase A2 domain-containing protein n=1 Tax=Goodea atripinnis TaxID=208336 RepID=A0ABV0NQM2_9TELE
MVPVGGPGVGCLEIGPEEGLDGEGLVPPPAWSVGKWIIGPATAHSAMGHAQKELLCLRIDSQDSRGLFLHNLQMQHSYLHKAVNIMCRDGDSSDTPHREFQIMGKRQNPLFQWKLRENWLPFLVDTGATFSTLNIPPSSDKVSDACISLMGFSGVKQTLPVSTPLHTMVGKQKLGDFQFPPLEALDSGPCSLRPNA